MMNRRVIYLMLLSGALGGLAIYSTGATGRQAQPAQEDRNQEKPAQKAGAKEKGQPDESARKSVLANVRAYMDAYNRQDVKALVNLFSEDCELTENDGTKIHGRKELEEELKESFEADPKAQISVAVESLTFLTPDVAIEQGRTTYYPDGKTLTAEAQYQVAHVKMGDRWLMRAARGFDRKILSPYDRLRDLNWLVGSWVDEGPDSLIETTYRWDTNKAFLLQDFTIRIKGQKSLTGTQRIGWDPLSKQIKSWVFDSDGGHGQSVWSAVEDNVWVIKMSGVRADGKLVSATNQLSQDTNDRLRFESVDRIVGEERMLNFTAFAVRKAPSAKN